MPLVDSTPMKEFEKPATGIYDSVLADVVDLGIVDGQYGPKHKYRLIWLLSALDTEKNNLRVMRQMNGSMFKATKPGQANSKLYETVKDVLGKAPDLPYELDELIGKCNQLVISLEDGPDGKKYSNIKAIMPAKVVVPVPATFVKARDKDKQKQGVVTAAPAAVAAPAVASTAPAVAVPEEEIPF